MQKKKTSSAKEPVKKQNKAASNAAKTASKSSKSTSKSASVSAKKSAASAAVKKNQTAKNSVKQSAKKNTAPKKSALHSTVHRRKKKNAPSIKISFLGGLNEIGKNTTMYEYGNDAVIVDCGMEFPDDTMLGIDLVIPDFTYIEQNRDKVKAILLTHGHEDHIGAIPYLLKTFNCPIYGTRLTLGLLEAKLREFQLPEKPILNVIKPGQTVDFGEIKAEFINVNHSIPDAVAIAIHSPAGVTIQTGDFKIDSTPIQGEMIDLGRLAQLGKKGVLCLLSDSTNAERPGYTPSESIVGNSINSIFSSNSAKNKRIIIATFASNVHRIQQIIDCAVRFDRKVAVSGRSMINVVNIGQELGYLNIPEGILIDLSTINRYPDEKIVLITTGSQGEPMSALTRMAFADHRQVEVGANDLIIISANPIPGNEKTVSNVVNELMRRGCEVVYDKMYEVHVSGHACREELKIILALTKPQYFIPVHGEQKHLRKHAELAEQMGIPSSDILVADVGDCVELSANEIKVVDKVPSGRVLVDGLGVGDVGSVVLRDRRHLAEDGLLVAVASIYADDGRCASNPNMISRGFVYVKDNEELMEDASELVRDIIDDMADRGQRDWAVIKNRIRDELQKMMYQRTKRSPMILPVLVEV